jgi:hypothetical protein
MNLEADNAKARQQFLSYYSVVELRLGLQPQWIGWNGKVLQNPLSKPTDVHV